MHSPAPRPPLPPVSRVLLPTSLSPPLPLRVTHAHTHTHAHSWLLCVRVRHRRGWVGGEVSGFRGRWGFIDCVLVYHEDLRPPFSLSHPIPKKLTRWGVVHCVIVLIAVRGTPRLRLSGPGCPLCVGVAHGGGWVFGVSGWGSRSTKLHCVLALRRESGGWGVGVALLSSSSHSATCRGQCEQ